MPIVELELVVPGESEKLGSEVIQLPAGQIGDYFGSKTAGTWVKVRYLDRSYYFESRPLENTHIIFETRGQGRGAFGGELVTQVQ